MPGSQKRVSESVLDGANLFSFSQFSCEKLKRFAPSEAVPGFLDGVTMRSLVFLSIFSELFTIINNAMLTTMEPTSNFLKTL